MDYNLQKDGLTKTPNLENVSSPHVDTSGRNDLFQVRKAGEDVTAALGTCCMRKDNVEGH
jgi:hypothetical protein